MFVNRNLITFSDHFAIIKPCFGSSEKNQITEGFINQVTKSFVPLRKTRIPLTPYFIDTRHTRLKYVLIKSYPSRGFQITFSIAAPPCPY